jgi:hypothetical protein
MGMQFGLTVLPTINLDHELTTAFDREQLGLHWTLNLYVVHDANEEGPSRRTGHVNISLF